MALKTELAYVSCLQLPGLPLTNGYFCASHDCHRHGSHDRANTSIVSSHVGGAIH